MALSLSPSPKSSRICLESEPQIPVRRGRVTTQSGANSLGSSMSFERDGRHREVLEQLVGAVGYLVGIGLHAEHQCLHALLLDQSEPLLRKIDADVSELYRPAHDPPPGRLVLPARCPRGGTVRMRPGEREEALRIHRFPGTAGPLRPRHLDLDGEQAVLAGDRQHDRCSVHQQARGQVRVGQQLPRRRPGRSVAAELPHRVRRPRAQRGAVQRQLLATGHPAVRVDVPAHGRQPLAAGPHRGQDLEDLRRRHAHELQPLHRRRQVRGAPQPGSVLHWRHRPRFVRGRATCPTPRTS